ncbi:MAG: hypothetical protein QOH24_1847, partial [Verrucomicrobiota bacterium]
IGKLFSSVGRGFERVKCPVNGHTSSDRLFGSDEKRAEKRKPRRRMRRKLDARVSRVVRFYLTVDYHQAGNIGRCRVPSVGGVAFRYRLRRWTGVLF